MGIRIDGNNDLINAADGTLTVEGLSVNVVGVSTASGGYKVGTAYTVFPNGNVATAGIITATGGQFNGDLLADALYTSDAIIHRGESGDDTKIRFPADDTVTAETSGSERVRIDSSGRIGIGDDSPTVQVSIKGTAPKIKLIDSDATGTPEALLDGSGGDVVIDVDKDDEKSETKFKVKIDGTERVNVDNTGSINVGTSATIKGNGNATFAGIVTAASFSGDGSNLSGIDATTIKDSGGNVVVQGTIGGAVVTGVMTANVSGVYLGTHAVGVGTTTTTGRDAGIGTPTGSLVFNHTTNTVQIFKGTKWSDISDGTFQATGGTKSSSGGKVYHTMTGATPFVVSSGSANIELLVIGGGGSGGGAEGAITGTNGGGGGGGAGAVIYKSEYPVSSGTYTISIGAGGAAVSTRVQGNDGGDTTFGPLTAGGGGGGGVASESPNVGDNAAGNAGTGGASSGGAGGGPNNAQAPDPPQSWPGSGDSPDTGWGGRGGKSNAYPNTGGAGGGGARYDGMNAITNNLGPADGCPGGQGVTLSTSGSPVAYAGGGGGATGAQGSDMGRGGTNNPGIGNYPYPTASAFGAGNGATISSGVITPATAVTANTGAGGGGGAEYPGGPSPNTCGGGAGASGIVVLNYDQ
tara:strand:+ start:160 stop:2064 length:1905 start_codon:yes stop_codon:yes gene_type:complete